MTTVNFKGQTYELVGQDKLTPGEAAEVERVTGLTFQKIRYISQRCVCDHPAPGHDPETTACKDESCPCDEFASDMPTVVSTAMMYVSIKRGLHGLKFSEVESVPFADFDTDDDEGGDDADPTGPTSPVE